MKNKLWIVVLLMTFTSVFAQSSHTVVTGDTPYSITKKYKITLEQLYAWNPQIVDGKINLGDVLAVSKNAKINTVTASKVGFILLQPKQTIYSITKKYHITIEELRALNPDLDTKTKIGDQIILPLALIKKYGEETPISVPEEPAKPIETNSNVTNTYVVQPKDTYYSITKKLNITKEKLIEYNPILEEKGLQPGSVLVLKKVDNNSTVKDTVTWQEEKPKKSTPINSVEDDFVYYTVKKDDTIFSILVMNDMKMDELMSLNPELADGLKEGMVIKVKPKQSEFVKQSEDGLNVVLMLPFGFNNGESKYRAMATDFLSGAKLAIERNVEIGKKLNIRIIDTSNPETFSSKTKEITNKNTDLIIGPFFKSNLLEVLNQVNAYKIPVVAPFANAPELEKFSNLVIVETNKTVYATRIAKEVSEVFADQKIYIVSDADQTDAVELKNILLNTVKNPSISIVSSPEEIVLEQNMMTGQNAPVISILTSENQAIGEAFTKKIIELSKLTAGNKSFSTVYQPSFEKNEDILSKSSLVYLMDRKINMDGSFEKEVLATYKRKYCKTPAKYAVIGFDVVNDMLQRENDKGELFKNMNIPQTQLATKFEFSKKDSSGPYHNYGYRVVRLIP